MAPADSPLPGVPLVLPSTVSAGVAPQPRVLLPGRGVTEEKKEKKKTKTPNQPAARAVSCLGTEGQVPFEPLMGAGGSAQGTWQLSAPAAELSACAGIGATWCGLLAGSPHPQRPRAGPLLAPVPKRAACPSQVRLKAPSHALSRSPRCQLGSFSSLAAGSTTPSWRFASGSHTRPSCRGTPGEGSCLKAPVCPSRAVLPPDSRNGRAVLTSVHLQHLLLLFLGCVFGTRPIPCPSSDA